MLDDDDELLQAKARIAARQAKEQRKLDARGTFDHLVAEVKRMLQGGPRVYEGDRLIHLNHAAMNAANKWPGNSVSTSKYNVVTFIPKFLIGELLSCTSGTEKALSLWARRKSTKL